MKAAWKYMNWCIFIRYEISHFHMFRNLLFRRVQFHLEEGGDLIWIVPPALEQESLPFFSCETFVVSAIVIYV